MKRYDCHVGEYFERPGGEFVRFEDHDAIIKRQASAALAGINAAKEISSNDVQRAARLRAESSPDALESERQANAKLTQELSLAEEGLANYQQENAQLRQENARLREVIDSRDKALGFKPIPAEPQPAEQESDRKFGVEDGYKPGWTEDT